MRAANPLLAAALFVCGAACGRSEAPQAEPSPRAPPPGSVGPVTLASALAKPVAPSGDCPDGWTCDPSAFDAQPRPRITQVLVQKSAHRLHLVADRTIVKSYRVALGSGGLGQKRYEGDKVTPHGRYTITGKYPSRWHTYLALDYPNADDRARHAELASRGEVPEGRGPGSGIAIHGRKGSQPDGLHKLLDWTLGCVSLDNPEIDEVASVAPIGTPVVIEP